MQAVVTNSGTAAARNVQLSWQLASGFEIVSEDGCDAIEPGSSCTFSLTAKATLSAALGSSQIKVMIRYD